MLVLTRKLGERIVINDDIVVTVVGLGQGGDKKVRLGIDAPPEVSVQREEVYLRLRQERGTGSELGTGRGDSSSHEGVV